MRKRRPIDPVVMPTWTVRSDPDYRRVRDSILRFLSTGRRTAYVDGRLNPDQEDDVQDVFLRYLTRSYSHAINDDVRIHFAVLYVIDDREQRSRIKVMGERVARRFISTT